MGGTQSMIDAQNEHEVLTKDLKHVNCYVFFSRINKSSIDYQVLYENLVRDISLGLKKYGITSYEFYEAGGGGDGLETIWDLLKILWENKDVISFVGSLISFFKNFFYQLEVRKVEKFYTEALVVFRLETNSKFNSLSKGEIEDTVSFTLANLLTITNAILDDQKSKYSAIHFNLSVEARLPFYDFSSTFNLIQEYRKSREKQMLRFLKSLKIKKGVTIQHDLIPLHFVKRTDRTVDSKGYSHFKKYYMLFSTKILRDYF